MNDYILRLENAVARLTGCASKYVASVTVDECFEGFRGKVSWQCEVIVFELVDHPKARRVYAWSNKDEANNSSRHVIVLEVPPINSACTAVAAAMAASIVYGSH